MIVEVKHLRRAFGSQLAVDDLSFSFASGEICGFIGPNGAGKTTSIRIMATIDLPDAGDVLYDGVSAVYYPDRVRGALGLMPDTLPDNRGLTVRDYLDFFARAYGIENPARNRRLGELDEMLQLSEMRDKQLTSLSKGMKQRVALARALVHDPEVLILDEPAAGLDPRARLDLRDLLRTLQRRGRAIFLSSHILADLEDICDSVVIIERGRMVRSGKISELGCKNKCAQCSFVKIRIASDPAAAKAVLATMPEVKQVSEISRTELAVEIEGDDAACSEVMKRLFDSGCLLIGFERREYGLEEIFLRATRGEVQ
ncbi:MAG: ABC transporter ATP-binding protein [Victivallaceae bacterium]|nr:ABC transporter ATP-binding protein [Victivallaceae bacterium]